MGEPASEPLHEALQRLAELPIGEREVVAFLQEHNLPAVFRELTAPHVSSVLLDHGCTALRKLFDSTAANTLQSAAPAPLRTLAVQLAARLAAGGAGAASEAQGQQAVELLLAAVGDEDVGVALQAERGLKQLAAAPAGLELLLRQEQRRLRSMAASADPTLRARALTLVVALASASPAATAAVRDAGLLQPLVEELSAPDDLLSCMAALQLVAGAARDPGMALVLADVVSRPLAALLAHAEPLLQCAALQAVAVLVGAVLAEGPAGMEVEPPAAPLANGVGEDAGAAPAAGQGDLPPLARVLLAALKAALDTSSTAEVPMEVEEAALDAVSTLGLQDAGTAALLLQPGGVIRDVAYKALGRPPSPAVRMAALHALAAVAGAERAAAAGGSRAAALLAPPAEAALREAVYEGAAAGGAGASATPAAVFLGQLQQPFLEHRVAAYRALSALLLRDWAAADACGNAELLDLLLDPKSESGLQGSEWRFACVAALAATLRAAGGTPASAPSPFSAVLNAALPPWGATGDEGDDGSGSEGSALVRKLSDELSSELPTEVPNSLAPLAAALAAADSPATIAATERLSSTLPESVCWLTATLERGGSASAGPASFSAILVAGGDSPAVPTARSLLRAELPCSTRLEFRGLLRAPTGAETAADAEAADLAATQAVCRELAQHVRLVLKEEAEAAFSAISLQDIDLLLSEMAAEEEPLEQAICLAAGAVVGSSPTLAAAGAAPASAPASPGAVPANAPASTGRVDRAAPEAVADAVAAAFPHALAASVRLPPRPASAVSAASDGRSVMLMRRPVAAASALQAPGPATVLFSLAGPSTTAVPPGSAAGAGAGADEGAPAPSGAACFQLGDAPSAADWRRMQAFATRLGARLALLQQAAAKEALEGSLDDGSEALQRGESLDSVCSSMSSRLSLEFSPPALGRPSPIAAAAAAAAAGAAAAGEALLAGGSAAGERRRASAPAASGRWRASC
eukprot:scaffold20.g7872.t1